jgi:Zn ribbon nucleic-acid-binding protein
MSENIELRECMNCGYFYEHTIENIGVLFWVSSSIELKMITCSECGFSIFFRNIGKDNENQP